jgi:hypothetical protein
MKIEVLDLRGCRQVTGIYIGQWVPDV